MVVGNLNWLNGGGGDSLNWLNDMVLSVTAGVMVQLMTD